MDEYLLEQGLEKAQERLDSDIAARQRANTLVKKFTEGSFLTEECDTCGDDLPTIRKEYGLRLCVVCQGKKEKRQKFGLNSE